MRDLRLSNKMRMNSEIAVNLQFLHLLQIFLFIHILFFHLIQLLKTLVFWYSCSLNNKISKPRI